MYDPRGTKTTFIGAGVLCIVLWTAIGLFFSCSPKAELDAQVGLSNRVTKLEAAIGDIESRVGGLHAGRDVTTSTEDSWQDVVVAGLSLGVIACLLFAWNRERMRMYAEMGICRMAGSIELERSRPEQQPNIADAIVSRIHAKGGAGDAVERIINRNVKKATEGAPNWRKRRE